MAKTKCNRCRGTGWANAARDSGTESLPFMHRQIGVYRCDSCGGSGLLGLAFTKEQLKELAKDVLTKIKGIDK